METTLKAIYIALQIAPLIALLLLSLLVSLILHRLPYVCFGISVLPMLWIMTMYVADSLYELIFGAPYDGKPIDDHFNTMYQGN